MKVLIPDDIIGDGKLVSSTVTDDLGSVAEYDSSTTYTTGAEVQYLHTKHTSTADSNTGNTPSGTSDYWTEGDPSNKYAMFDSYVSTQTEGSIDTDIVVVLDSSKADSLCLLNCENVLSVTVAMEYTPTGETVMDETIYMTRSARDAVSASWWEYFFGETEYREQLFLEFDAWTNSQITLTITPVAGYAAKIGHCLIGQTDNIGTAQWGVSPSLIDYSTKTTDDTTGKTSLVAGSHAKDLDVPLWINNGNLDTVFRTLTSARATPAVWNANENNTEWESIITFGFIREFSIIIPGTTHSTCTLQVEGLI
jgi:hypothetical protein